MMKVMMKTLMKASAYVLLIGLLVYGPALGFASAQDVFAQDVYAEGDDCGCPMNGMWCEYGCNIECTGDCAPERKNYDDCAEDADCPCSGLYCASACDSGCKGDCAPDLEDVYDGCANACCINETDCKHECPNHADCDCPEDNGGDPTDPDDNNGKYPIDTAVPWYRYPELTESGDLILTFIYTGELDDLWVWRSDDEGEVWIPYWNTLGSGTANGQITVVSERPDGDYLYVTIPDVAAEFPAETLLVFETQHPEIVCVMYINLELEFGWVDTLGNGGDRTGVDKFPRPPKDGEGDDNGDNNKPPYTSVPNKPPVNEPDTDGEKPPDGANTGSEPPPATNQNTNGGIPLGTGTTPGNQLPLRNEVIAPEARSELNAPDASAASDVVVSDGYPSASDITPNTTPKSAPPTDDAASPSAWSNRAFTAMVAIGIAAALLVGAGLWINRRKLRSR